MRDAKSLYVHGLAYDSSIDSSNIRAYKDGRAMMDWRSLGRIAYALGVDPGAPQEGVEPSMFGKDA